MSAEIRELCVCLEANLSKDKTQWVAIEVATEIAAEIATEVATEVATEIATEVATGVATYNATGIAFHIVSILTIGFVYSKNVNPLVQ